MKSPVQIAALTLLLSTIHSPFSTGFAQGTAFTYQGRLTAAGGAANGHYDLRFAIYDADSSGAAQGGFITNAATAVSNGLFTVALDFGQQFPGAERWLELAVRTNGGGAFTTLSPRQPLRPTPYAIHASTADNVGGPIPASQLAGVIPLTQLSGLTSAQIDGATWQLATNVNGGNAASLGGLGASNFWQLNGNNVAAGQFLGSTSSQPLVLKGNFVGIGRSNRVTSAEYFGIDAPAPSGYGGMYLNTTNPAGWPFYGYAQAGAVRAYHYVDGGDTNKWKLNVGGSLPIVATTGGSVGIGTANPSAKLEVAGQVKITGGAPGAGKLLMSDATGLASWQPPSALSVFFGQNYSVLIPDVIDNTAYLEIEGIMSSSNVVVINGPGLAIQRIAGFSGTNHNDQPGPNMEYPFVFESGGTETNALQDWFQNYSINGPRPLSLFVKNLAGIEQGRWNLYEMRCTQIEAGTDGRQRYTLQHTLPPNNRFGYERDMGDPPANASKNPATDLYRVEIEGVLTGPYPVTEIDYTNRTLTLTFDYVEAGHIHDWTRAIAEGLPDKRAMSVITEVNGVEVSRRNFFGVFTISFQYLTGFGQVDKFKERVVLSFDFWENG